LLLRPVLGKLQQNKFGVLEQMASALTLQFPRFLRTNLIDLLVELLHHVEAIQDVQHAFRLLRDHRHVIAPHVRANELQPCERSFWDHVEESSQTFLRSVLGHVQQTPTIRIDLVHQRQVLVPPAVGDFIDADRFNFPDFPMNHALMDDPLHRPKHRVPTRAEDRRGLLPTEPLGPGREKNPVTVCRAVLAIGPRHPFDGHAATRAVDAAHAVQEEHRNGPERDEFESSLAERVVPRALLAAPATDRPTAAVRMDVDQDFTAAACETWVTVDETLLLFDAVEDSLELHLVRSEVDGGCGKHHQ